jgi:hypothetical protein
LEILTVDDKTLGLLGDLLKDRILTAVAKECANYRNAVLTKAGYNPLLHPRGPDGKWTATGGERGPLRGYRSPQSSGSDGNPSHRRDDDDNPSVVRPPKEALENKEAQKLAERYGKGAAGIARAIVGLWADRPCGEMLRSDHRFSAEQVGTGIHDEQVRNEAWYGAHDRSLDTSDRRAQEWRDYITDRVKLALMYPDQRGIVPGSRFEGKLRLPYFLRPDNDKTDRARAIRQRIEDHIDAILIQADGKATRSVIGELIQRRAWPLQAAGQAPGAPYLANPAGPPIPLLP